MILIPVILIAAASVFQTEVKCVFAPERAVEKNISFSVYKTSSYNSAVYSNTSAQVHIIVEKVRGNIRTKVWEQTLDAKQLSQYPTIQQAMTQTIKVPGVHIKKERIEVSYTLTYDSQGSTLQMQGGTVMTECCDTDKLDITI